MYEMIFKSIDDILREDAGCSSELDYIEQTSWILFLKYLDDFESEKEAAAELKNQKYKNIIGEDFSWSKWAAPRFDDGRLDYNSALTGDDLLNFVNQKLFPYLSSFKQITDNPKSLNYKIGEIFSELRNKVQSGYALRNVINKINELKFLSNNNKHELSSLYEDKIKNMGNAGRNGGEYYTPRSLIKNIVKVINPKIKETIYDGAVGSAGFLCEAYDLMRSNNELSATDYDILQKNTFFGKEKKSLAYVIGIMNMILHGIEAPNITHINTLSENISDIQQKDKVDVVLANPPFGGKERVEIQQNFPIKTSETAYLFLQHFIKILKTGGRSGVIIKSTFLTANDNASVSLRKQLLTECNLHSVLILPKGVFAKTPATTVVLFFEKGSKTESIWFYKLKTKQPFGINNPLREDHLSAFMDTIKDKKKTETSWIINTDELNQETFRLPIKHPDANYIDDVLSSNEIKKNLIELTDETTELLEKIGG